MNTLFKLGRITEETMALNDGTYFESNSGLTCTADSTKTGRKGC